MDAFLPGGHIWWKGLLLAGVLLAFSACVKSEKEQKLDLAGALVSSNLFSDEQIRKDFVNLTVTPFQREELAFSMLVPNGWRDNPLQVPAEIIKNATAACVPLSEQLAPEDQPGHARIEVRYTKLDLVVRLPDWVEQFISSAGYTLLRHRHAVFNGRVVEDNLVRVVKGGKSYIARMTFSKHGERIFLVSASAEEGYFNRYARIFGAAVVSFTPRQGSASEFAEPMKVYVNPGPPALEFRYPASWKVKEPDELPPGKTGVDLFLSSAGKVVGYLHVKAIAKSSKEFPQLIKAKVLDDFKSAGVKPVVKSRTLELAGSATDRVDVWDIVSGGVHGELAVTVLGGNSGYVALGMMMPIRKQNPWAWMTAWRVFEIVYHDCRKLLDR